MNQTKYHECMAALENLHLFFRPNPSGRGHPTAGLRPGRCPLVADGRLGAGHGPGGPAADGGGAAVPGRTTAAAPRVWGGGAGHTGGAGAHEAWANVGFKF